MMEAAISSYEKLDVFSRLDHFFAQRVLFHEKNEQKSCYDFLCYLMACFRNGHICVLVNAEQVKPNLDFSDELTKSIQAGAEYYRKNRCSVIQRENDLFYLQRNWALETYILENLSNRTKQNGFLPINTSTVKKYLSEKLNENVLLEKQALAIEQSLSKSFVTIFGGPGTGKSYTAIQLVDVLLKSWESKRSPEIVFVAPTGKAAKLLESKLMNGVVELQGAKVVATTMHALLKIPYRIPEGYSPAPIDADCMILDESSMVDPQLFAFLMEAISESTHLICMGDPDQLPSVEGGSLFMDFYELSELGLLPGSVTLEQAVRFESGIVYSLAKALNEQDFEKVSSLLGDNQGQLEFIPWKSSESALETSVRWFLNLIKGSNDPLQFLTQLDEFRVLSCMRQGPWGVESLNRKIFHRIIEEFSEKELLLPILIVQNDSSQGLFNGMVGVVAWKNKNRLDYRSFAPDEHVYFQVDNQIIQKPLYSLPKWEFAFVLSVHKSQGSEFRDVLFFVPEGSEVFGKEILYTGATRAKSGLSICGELKTIELILQQKSKKVSGLIRRWKS